MLSYLILINVSSSYAFEYIPGKINIFIKYWNSKTINHNYPYNILLKTILVKLHFA